MGIFTIKWKKKTYIVAEISSNHHGVFQKAVQLIYTAAAAGADAVKFQMFTPDDLTLKTKDERFLIKSGPWSGKYLHDLYAEAQTPYEWIPELQKTAHKEGLDFFPTVYHPDTVELAEEYDFPFYKVASFEVNYTELLERLKQTNKPIMISTGAATLKEIYDCVKILNDVVLLKCTSEYPAPLDEMNLNTIPDMIERFGCYVGLSDHSLGIVAPVVAVSLGARVIEKHLTLDCAGLDGGFSMTTDSFMTMVETIRAAERTLGGISYDNPTKYKRQRVKGRMVRVC